MIVEKISLEVSGDIENLENLFKLSPKKTEVAIDRTMRKLGKWSEIQVLRVMSRRLQITQKRLKEFGRIRTYLSGGYNGSRYLTVWIGTIQVGAHRFGRTSQRQGGVNVGRRTFYEGAFLMQPVNANRALIFERKENWTHKWRKSRVSGRMMWMGLPIYSHKVHIYNDARQALNELEPKIFSVSLPCSIRNLTMPSTSNQEKIIVEKLIEHLKVITDNVQLGYSGTGLENDIELPAILVQLESINEEQRQGQRAKYRMEFNISAVAKTNTQTTYTLIDLTRSIRELFTTGKRFTPEARNITFSETQFDIAPSNAHLSFADLQLQIEVVL